MDTTNELTIFSPENVQMIAVSAPDAYAICKHSHDSCLSVGKAYLDTVESCGGQLTDELDQTLAKYIDKSRRTVKKLNDTRSPITKLFDQFRANFTSMENACDPTKKDSIPYKLQQYRNQYAAQKRAEAERARQAEMARQRAEAERRQYSTDVEEDYKAALNRKINESLNHLQYLFSGVTLENYEEVFSSITAFSVKLGDFCPPSTVRLPSDVPADELRTIRIDIFNRCLPKWEEQYTFEIGDQRETLLAMLPSKRQELQRIAQANAEEAARMKAELAAREAEEARRAEEARKAKEAQEATAKQMAAQQNEMDSLFTQAALSSPEYQPKTQVKQRINILAPEGIAACFMLWWHNEGVRLSIEELNKIFKKQITFCEKLANDKDNPTLVDSPFVQYVEEVKAK
jgi:hypothetical protein